jgi:hypothetical protein
MRMALDDVLIRIFVLCAAGNLVVDSVRVVGHTTALFPQSLPTKKENFT